VNKKQNYMGELHSRNGETRYMRDFIWKTWSGHLGGG